MRTTFLTSMISFLLLLCILGSCDTTSGGIKATGTAYDIVVVTDRSIWDDLVGDQLKEELAGPIKGLNQPESAMRITYVPTSQFGGMLTYVRNILVVNIDEQHSRASLRTEVDRWAAGQVVAYLTAPNIYVLIDYLDRNQGRIVDFFSRVEMRRMAEVMLKTHNVTVMEKVKSKFDIMLCAPREMKAFNKDESDFFWTSNNAPKGQIHMVVYTFPYTDPQTFTREYMLAMRDSVLGANIPGSFPNTYMSTNAEFTTYTPITLYGKYCGVLRGLWETTNPDMMGGPFVSFARLDEVNNRVVVAEGFVYAPEQDKKSFMRRLEASLYTLRLPGEFELSLDGPVMND